MQVTISAASLAGLPGMPGTARNVRLKAQRENWATTSTRQGACLVPVAALPAETRLHLCQPELPSATEVHGRTLGGQLASTWQAASTKARARAVERIRVLALDEALRAAGLPAADVAKQIADETGVPDRTVRRWRRSVARAPREDWAALLLPGYKATRPPRELHPDAWNFFLSDYHRFARPAMSACYRRLQQEAQRQNWGSLPSQSAMRRRYNREVATTTTLLRREGEEALEHCIPAQRRDKSGLRAMQHVNADGHKFDVFVRWPNVDPTKKAQIARPLLLAWQDIYSGKILSWRLDVTENVDVVRLSFADMLKEHGIPERATIDNGRSFAGKHMTGGMVHRNRFKVLDEEPLGIYKAFDVKAHFTIPYHGQSKPIERAFRDLCEDIAKHPFCQGAYTGNSPMAKPADYGKRAVDYDDFAQLVAEQITEHNAREGRRSGTCKGRSLDQTFTDSLAEAGTVVRRATEAQIQWLLLPIEGVRVGKDEAAISLMGNRFFHPALLRHRGKKMLVRFDPYNIQAGIYVFEDGQREPLCKAECIMPVGFRDTDAARRDARARKALKKAEKDIAKASGTIAAHRLGRPAQAPEPPAPRTNVVKGHFTAKVPQSVESPEQEQRRRDAVAMRQRLGRRELRKPDVDADSA